MVISFLVMALAGVVYFQKMYTRKIQTMRVARAAAVQYALAGCQGDPAAGLGPDMAGLTPSNRSDDRNVTNSQDTSREMSGSSEARSATRTIPGTGGFFLNPIRDIGMRGGASVGPSVGAQRFQSDLASASHQSCPDRVRPMDQTFSEVIGYIGGLFF